MNLSFIQPVGCINDIAKKIIADNQILVTGLSKVCTFQPIPCGTPSRHDHAQTTSCRLRWCAAQCRRRCGVRLSARTCSTISSWRSWANTTTIVVEDEFAAARDILKELRCLRWAAQAQAPPSELVVGMKWRWDGLSAHHRPPWAAST